jgi:flagellum-specific peptidoglycan hydrolase FlgJ
MVTPREFLDKAYRAAIESGHIFPEFAVCEAALESAFGNSKLCILGNNLFGQKSGSTTKDLPTIPMPTKENVDLNKDGKIDSGEVVIVQSNWVKFPDWTASFRARMELLQRLAPRFPHYAFALNAKTGREFVEEVSKSWSTDPIRAIKVLAIYDKHFPG